MIADKTQYLTAGIHIGMKTCTPYLRQFVYKVREDGLAVFNLQLVDERIRIAAGFLSHFRNLLVVSRKENGQKAAKAFADAVGAKAVTGRFTPGTLTNPHFRGFFEPDAVLVVDPLIDSQVVAEAKKKRIPIIALCDTFNLAKDIDYVIPLNNNGRKSLALVFWILARQILRQRGQLAKDEDFRYTLKDFGDEDKPVPEGEGPEGPKPEAPPAKPRKRKMKEEA